MGEGCVKNPEKNADVVYGRRPLRLHGRMNDCPCWNSGGDLWYTKIRSLLILRCLQFHAIHLKYFKYASAKIQVHICNQWKQKRFLRGDERNQNLERTSHN